MTPHKKVLLVFPAPISQMPVGLGYIAAIFEKNKFSVKIVVNTFKKPKDAVQFLSVAKDFQPDLIGVSFTTLGILEIYKLTQAFKKQHNVPLIAGGVHPSTLPEEVLENGFDIVVRNEGENTIEEICDRFKNGSITGLDTIKGISYWTGDQIVHNVSRERIQDLDALPFPARHLFDPDDFSLPDGSPKGFERIFTGRGCPSQCTFCNNAVFERKYVHRSVESIINEIKLVKDTYGVTHFELSDDTLTINRIFISELCSAIVDAGLSITWAGCTRINAVTHELLDNMKRAGCIQLSFGAESGDDTTLTIIKKGQTVDDIIKAVTMTYNTGIKVYLNIMTGFPWETTTHVQNTINVINKILAKVHTFQVLGSLTPFPGTDIYDEYHKQFDFTDYWLRDDVYFQNAGHAIYQNVANPYEVGVFYQRTMYDDFFIFHDTFFRYTPEYKNKVREMCFLIGKHNLNVRFDSKSKIRFVFLACKASRYLYEINPMIEKVFMKLFKPTNKIHNIKIGQLHKVEEFK